MSESKLDRRGFVAGVAAVGAAGALAQRVAAQEAAKPMVVVVHAPGVSALEGDALARRIRQMLTAGLDKLTGLEGAASWEHLFKPTDTVALKVNCLAPTVGTRVALADSVARGVMRAGVPGEKTLVWERSERELVAAGYTLGGNERGYQVVATDKAGGYAAEAISNGTVNQKLANVLTQATALVNLPIVKDHNLAGLTGALKNHFGSINEPWKLHGAGIGQAIADLNAAQALRDRHRLVVGDAITVVYEGGPTDQPKYRSNLDSILIATDPVAHDAVGLSLIEEQRLANGLRPLGRSGRPVTYLALAEQAGVGVATLDNITIERLELTEA